MKSPAPRRRRRRAVQHSSRPRGARPCRSASVSDSLAAVNDRASACRSAHALPVVRLLQHLLGHVEERDHVACAPPPALPSQTASNTARCLSSAKRLPTSGCDVMLIEARSASSMQAPRPERSALPLAARSSRWKRHVGLHRLLACARRCRAPCRARRSAAWRASPAWRSPPQAPPSPARPCAAPRRARAGRPASATTRWRSRRRSASRKFQSCGSRTNVPSFGRERTSPLAASICSASRRQVRLTPNSPSSAASFGSGLPADSRRRGCAARAPRRPCSFRAHACRAASASNGDPRRRPVNHRINRGKPSSFTIRRRHARAGNCGDRPSSYADWSYEWRSAPAIVRPASGFLETHAFGTLCHPYFRRTQSHDRPPACDLSEPRRAAQFWSPAAPAASARRSCAPSRPGGQGRLRRYPGERRARRLPPSSSGGGAEVHFVPADLTDIAALQSRHRRDRRRARADRRCSSTTPRTTRATTGGRDAGELGRAHRGQPEAPVLRHPGGRARHDRGGRRLDRQFRLDLVADRHGRHAGLHGVEGGDRGADALLRARSRPAPHPRQHACCPAG